MYAIKHLLILSRRLLPLKCLVACFTLCFVVACGGSDDSSSSSTSSSSTSSSSTSSSSSSSSGPFGPLPEALDNIQAILSQPELNCTNAGCHTEAPGFAKVNLKTGSLTDLAKRLVDIPSGSDACQNEKLIDSVTPSNSLLLKLIDPDSGDQCMAKMPFGAGSNGVPSEYLPLFEAWVTQIIAAAEPVDTPEQQPFEPTPAIYGLSKVKKLLHGGAITNAEYQTLVSENGVIDRSQLKTQIAQWMTTEQYVKKMDAFIQMALQMRKPDEEWYRSNVIKKIKPGDIKREQDDGRPDPRPVTRDYIAPTADQVHARTYRRIIIEDEDFRTVVTGRKFEMNTAALALWAYVDQNYANKPWRYFNGQYGKGQFDPATDFDDWRTIEIVPSDTAVIPSWDSLRAIPDGGTFALRTPRVGFWTAPMFFENWPTNPDNQFRVTMNQMLIAALGKSFEAGDASKPDHEDGVAIEHAPKGSECFQCHKNMDPMRNVYNNYFSPDDHTLAAISDEPLPFDHRLAFAFHGYKETVNTPQEFAQAVVNHPYFPMAWTLKLCQWANARPCDANAPDIQRIAEAFKLSGFKFSVLLTELFSSSIVLGDLDVGLAPQYRPRTGIARRDHFCASVSEKIAQVRQARGYEKAGGESRAFNNLSIEDFAKGPCRIYRGDELSNAIPIDRAARAQTDFVQGTNKDFALVKIFGRWCDTAAMIYVNGNDHGSFKTDMAWRYCAKEGERCSFTGNKVVRYGQDVFFKTGTFQDDVNCSGGPFGGDPHPGRTKRCWVLEPVTSSPPNPQNALVDMTRFFIGFPESTPEYQETLSALSNLYAFANKKPLCNDQSALPSEDNPCGLGLSQHDATELVFRSACRSPMSTGLGL